MHSVSVNSDFAAENVAWNNLNAAGLKTPAEIIDDMRHTAEAVSVTGGLIYHAETGKPLAAFGTLSHLADEPHDDVPRDCYGADLGADIAGRDIARAARKAANKRRYVRMMARRGVYVI